MCYVYSVATPAVAKAVYRLVSARVCVDVYLPNSYVHTVRGRNNGRSSVNFRAFFKMTAHFSTCSVRVTDHVRIIAQLV